MPVSTVPDTAAPNPRVRILRPAIRNRRLRVAVTCDEACRVAVASRLRGIRRLAVRQRALAAGRRTVVRPKLSRKVARRMRRTLRRRGYVRIAVRVRAVDAAGNARVVTRRGRMTR